MKKAIAELPKLPVISLEKRFSGDILLEPKGSLYRVYLNGKQVATVDRKENKKAVLKLREFAKEQTDEKDPRKNEFFGKNVSFSIKLLQKENTPVFSLLFDGVLISTDTANFFTLENLDSVAGMGLKSKFRQQQREIEALEETQREKEEIKNIPQEEPKQLDKSWMQKEIEEIQLKKQEKGRDYLGLGAVAVAQEKEIEMMKKGAEKISLRVCKVFGGNFVRCLGRFRYDKNNQSCLICLKTENTKKKLYLVITLFVDGSISYRPYSRGSAKEYDFLPWFTGAIYPSNGKFYVQQMLKDIGDDLSGFGRMTFTVGSEKKFPENKSAEHYIPVVEKLSRRKISRLIGSVDYSSTEEFRSGFIDWLEEKNGKNYKTWLDAYASFYQENAAKGLIPKWWVSPLEFDSLNLYEQMGVAK